MDRGLVWQLSIKGKVLIPRSHRMAYAPSDSDEPSKQSSQCQYPYCGLGLIKGTVRSGGHSTQLKALRAGELAYAMLVCKKKKSHQSIRFHPRPLVPSLVGENTHVCIKNSRCMSVDSILVLSFVSFVGENTHVCIKNSRCDVSAA